MEVSTVTDQTVLEAIAEAADPAALADGGQTRQAPAVHAVDITFRNADGEEIEPAEGSVVRVTMDSSAAAAFTNPSVVHYDGQDNSVETMELETVDMMTRPALDLDEDNALAFATDAFSVYAVVETTIEKNVLASDGHNYRISVTYGPESGIPDNAELDVAEILSGSDQYDMYVSKAEDALSMEEGSAGYIRLFDIKIVDPNGEKVRIEAPVDVKIELADKESLDDAADATHVVHFADGADTGDVVQNVAVDGTAVSFAADGFSAYAIVEGPGSVPTGTPVTDLDELNEEDGFYIYNKDSTVASYLIDSISGGKIATTNTQLSAAKYYFESTDSGKYRIYYKDDQGNKYYLCTKKETNGSFYVKSGFESGYDYEFTVKESTSGDVFHFSSATANPNDDKQNYWYNDGGAIKKNRQFANGDTNAAGSTVSVTGNSQKRIEFAIIRAEDITGDPYNLDGQSYGLLNWNGGAMSRALMAEALGENALGVKPLCVMARRPISP